MSTTKLKLGTTILVATLLISGCDILTHSGDDLVASGSAFMVNGQYMQAEAAFRKAMDLPLTRFSKEQLYTLMGNNFVGRGLYDSAVVYHRKAVELNDGYAEAWINLGVAERRLKHNDEAEKAYQKALTLAPKDVYLLTNLGALYVDTGRAEEGQKLLSQAVAIDSSHIVAHANLATAFAMLGDTTAADAEMAKAKSLGYENIENLEDYIQRQKDSVRSRQAPENLPK
jgi:Flp pilus assembly protein TadD